MVDIFETLEGLGIKFIPVVRIVLIVLALFVVFSIILGFIKRGLMKRAKSKKQKSNIQIFSRIFQITFLVLIVIVAIFSYVGSFTGLGIAAGLISAALGWALQRPITGVAAWVMVVVKRPFNIGDRIIIGDVKGDVKDITLTHIVLDEVGGLVNSEVASGRVIMVPNYLLYELNIINYTHQNDFIIGETIVQITYESNLDKAIKISFDSAMKFTEEASQKLKQEPMIRIAMAGSGIDIKVRFYGEAYNIQKITSDITKEIYDRIQKEKDVEIAYPHTEVVFKNKKLFGKG
ncbi:MAG: mechanosensitive ion channel family protein [Nanoarchaeota archaeon]|nr:mechanosensitive ion channel family protein [Nanoarchaeota archaeon]